MSLIAKAKETLVEYAVLSVLGVIGVLVLILWKAVPATFWQSISDVIDKNILWALLGLSFFIIVGQAVYIVQSYLRVRTTLHHFGGVLWNSNCELFCPKDETPIFQSGKTFHEDYPSLPRVEIYRCPKCDSSYIFTNSEGGEISFADAKKGFLTQQSLKTKGSKELPEVVEGFDDITLRVLKAFGGTTIVRIAVDQLVPAVFKDIKPVVISHSLDILNKKGLLARCTTQYVGKNIAYELTPKGREYIVKNGLV